MKKFRYIGAAVVIFLAGYYVRGKQEPTNEKEISIQLKKQSAESIYESENQHVSDGGNAIVLSGLIKDTEAVFVQDRDGKTQGLKLVNVPPGSIYEKAGFKSGDVIERFGGIDLTSSVAMLKALKKYK